MSLSNPSKKNPAELYIEWKGSVGKFKYYDKEQKQDVFFEKPIYIIPLDELSKIVGFDDDSQSGFYSNEVRFTTSEQLVIKTKRGVEATGLYATMKIPNGAKYAKSVYAALIEGNKENTTVRIVNLSMFGAAIGSWIDAKINTDSGEVIELSPSTDKLKKGATLYYAPKITKKGLRKDILDKCIDLDKELQDYLKSYFNHDEEVAAEIIQEHSQATSEKVRELENEVKDTKGTEPEEDDGLPF